MMERRSTLYAFEPPKTLVHKNMTAVVDALLYKYVDSGVPTGDVLFFKEDVRGADLELMGALPFEVEFYKNAYGFVVHAGEKRAVPRSGAGPTSFRAHNHLGDNPGISEPEDITHLRVGRIEMIISRYGITFISENALSMPGKELSLRDLIAHARGRSAVQEREQKLRGLSDGFVRFTEKEKIALICDFLNGHKTWDDVRGPVLADA